MEFHVIYGILLVFGGGVDADGVAGGKTDKFIEILENLLKFECLFLAAFHYKPCIFSIKIGIYAKSPHQKRCQIENCSNIC